MLDSFKRLFGARAEEQAADYAEVAAWAQRRGFGLKRVRGEEGFVIDGKLEDKPWRLEWGAPQRDYIAGHELRLRMELDLPSDAQMLVLSRTLMDALERKTFEDFTDSVQTQIGTATPEEMRWLVMFPKVNLASLKTLRTHFGAVASAPDAGLAWLTGPLSSSLEQAALRLVPDQLPFVLMTLRGRAYLRMQMRTPNARDINEALALFETAVAQAVLVARHASGKASHDSGDSSASTAWQTMQPPDGVGVPRKPG